MPRVKDKLQPEGRIANLEVEKPKALEVEWWGALEVGQPGKLEVAGPIKFCQLISDSIKMISFKINLLQLPGFEISVLFELMKEPFHFFYHLDIYVIFIPTISGFYLNNIADETQHLNASLSGIYLALVYYFWKINFLRCYVDKNEEGNKLTFEQFYWLWQRKFFLSRCDYFCQSYCHCLDSKKFLCEKCYNFAFVIRLNSCFVTKDIPSRSFFSEGLWIMWHTAHLWCTNYPSENNQNSLHLPGSLTYLFLDDSLKLVSNWKH